MSSQAPGSASSLRRPVPSVGVGAMSGQNGYQEPMKVLVVKIKTALGMKENKPGGKFNEDSEAYVRIILTDERGRKLQGIPVQNTNKMLSGGANKEWNEVFTLGPLQQPERSLVKLNILDNPHKFKELAGKKDDEDLQDATIRLDDLDDSPEWQDKEVQLKGAVWSAMLAVSMSTNGTWGKVQDGQSLGVRVRNIENLKVKGSSKMATVRIKIVDAEGKQIKKHKETKLLDVKACDHPGFKEEDEFPGLDDPGNLKLRVNIVGQDLSQKGAVGMKPTVRLLPDEDDSSGDTELDLNEVKKMPGFQRFDVEVNGKEFAGTVKLYLSSQGEWGLPPKGAGCLCY